jgi:hypothetical protein
MTHFIVSNPFPDLYERGFPFVSKSVGMFHARVHSLFLMNVWAALNVCSGALNPTNPKP